MAGVSILAARTRTVIHHGPLRSAKNPVHALLVASGEDMRADFLLISVVGVFDPRHRVGLERVSFLKQLITLSESALSTPDNPCKSPIARPNGLALPPVRMPPDPLSGSSPGPVS